MGNPTAALLAITAMVGFAACDGSAVPDGAVWSSDATKMVAEDHGGGFTGPTPVGSPCPYPSVGIFTLTVADQRLTWRTCQRSPTSSLYEFVDGARTLTGGEMSMVVTALDLVTISKATSCGADKQTLTLTVTTARKEITYLDDFYSCEKQGIYVQNIDGVLSLVRALAK